MIPTESSLFRKIWLWVLIIACALVAACLSFFSIVSVLMGIRHAHQAGFWVPILGGTLSFGFVLWLFLRIARGILNEMKEDDLVEL